jgi:hypothetical protein
MDILSVILLNFSQENKLILNTTNKLILEDTENLLVPILHQLINHVEKFKNYGIFYNNKDTFNEVFSYLSGCKKINIYYNKKPVEYVYL